jgi:hypothetical protein
MIGYAIAISELEPSHLLCLYRVVETLFQQPSLPLSPEIPRSIAMIVQIASICSTQKIQQFHPLPPFGSQRTTLLHFWGPPIG